MLCHCPVHDDRQEHGTRQVGWHIASFFWSIIKEHVNSKQSLHSSSLFWNTQCAGAWCIHVRKDLKQKTAWTHLKVVPQAHFFEVPGWPPFLAASTQKSLACKHKSTNNSSVEPHVKSNSVAWYAQTWCMRIFLQRERIVFAQVILKSVMGGWLWDRMRKIFEKRGVRKCFAKVVPTCKSTMIAPPAL